MGWGITINGIYFSRITKKDIKDRLEDSRSLIDMMKNELIALSSYTNPIYFNGEDNISLPEFVAYRVPHIIEDLKEECFKLGVLEYAIENMDDVSDT